MYLLKKRKLISGALALAMASSLLLTVPVHASSDEPDDRLVTNEAVTDGIGDIELDGASEDQKPDLDAAGEPASEDVGFQEESAETPAEEDTVEVDADMASDDNAPAAEEPELTESLEEMERTVPFSALTDDWSENLVAVALSQLGYKASETHYTRCADWCAQHAQWWIDSAGNSVSQELRQLCLPSWDGFDSHADWNAAFVTFCLYYAGVDIAKMPVMPSAEQWAFTLKEIGAYSPEDYAPAPGDLVFFDWYEENNTLILDERGEVAEIVPVADRVGIVSYVNSEKLKVVIGDYNGGVVENTYSLNDGAILGYGVLPEEPHPNADPSDDGDDTAEESIAESIAPDADEHEEKMLTETEEIELLPENPQLGDELPGGADKATDECVDAEDSPAPDADVPEETLSAVEEEPLPDEAEEAAELSELDLELDGAAETFNTIPYAFAPEGYRMLCVADTLEETQVYYYDAQPMYYTEADAYQVGDSNGVFYALVPMTDDPNKHLGIREGTRASLYGDMDINSDGIVNIADANALYQMIQNPNYYDVTALGLEARLKADVNLDCICSIADLDEVVDAINGM